MQDKNNSRKYITPASCLQVYPIFAKNKIKSLRSALVTARCARFEENNYVFPFRNSNFTMKEFVAVGSAGPIESLRMKILEKIQNTFNKLRLGGSFENSADAFFMGNDAGAKIIQKLKGLKQEYIVSVNKQHVALASINYHEDYFVRRFNIKGNKLHSFCAAFGIERLVAYSLLAWGNNLKSWPKEFKNG